MERNGSGRTFLDRALVLVGYLSMGILVLLAMLVLLQITLRNLFSIAFAWLDELARWSQVSMVYLSVPLLAQRNQVLEVDSFVKMFPHYLRNIVAIFSAALTFAFCVVFLWSGYALMGKAGTVKTPALGLPNNLFFAPVFLGMVLLGGTTLQAILQKKWRPE